VLHGVWSSILRGIEQVMIYIYIGVHVKYPLFFSDANENLLSSTDFRKNLPASDFMKIRPVGAELFHAGWTD
jgi:hypothetical protein